MTDENCLHVVAEKFDKLGIVNIQWGVIQDSKSKLKFGMTLTYEVMSEILIIAMETWMTEKKPKTVNLLALNKNQS